MLLFAVVFGRQFKLMLLKPEAIDSKGHRGTSAIAKRSANLSNSQHLMAGA
jgi:hypothetical protein